MRYRNKTTLFLGLFILVSLFFSFYKINQVPPCINADEAAFGYNAYSLLKTGKDEYGAFMPMRLVSFRDYKLPLYSYLSMPFMAVFGLNDFSTRALNIVIAALYVPLIFFLAKELFENEIAALIAAFLVSISPWIYILTRHAHEGPLATFFIILSVYFLIRFHKTRSVKVFLLTNISIVLAAFSYQSARLFLLFIIFSQIYILLRSRQTILASKNIKYFLVLFFGVVLSFYPDIKYGVNRVQNLVFYKDPGFALRITEYLGEHPNRIIHNKLIESVRDVTNRFLLQISPEFLVINGDTNRRFGFSNLGLITPIEYLFIFIGIYYLFKNKTRYRFFLLAFLFISPLPNALTWQDASLIRSYIMIFSLLICVGYGIYHILIWCQNNIERKKSIFVYFTIIALFIFYAYNNWDVYFNHYPKRAVIGRAWQCGYKDLTNYIKDNYNKFERFVITDRHGQPYIYLLYYLALDPGKYQEQAKISGPDKYGFGQVDKYDKFIFKFRYDKKAKNTVYIGYPDEFNDVPVDSSQLKKINFGTDEVFWIYET